MQKRETRIGIAAEPARGRAGRRLRPATLLFWFLIGPIARGQSSPALLRGSDTGRSPRPALRHFRTSDANSDVQTSARFSIESGAVAFGDVIPGTDQEVRDALRIRVFSPGEWVLRLVPDSPVLVGERGAAVPVSRISWRTRSGAYVRLMSGAAAAVARGSSTRSVGEVVSLDLKILLESGDDVGRYACTFRLMLQPL